MSVHMRGTAIEPRNKQNSGWAQQGAIDLLKVTYPTADVQRALDAVSTAGAGKPVVFKGNRGRGKSHNLALLYHAFESPDEVGKWAKEWAQKIRSAKLAGLKLQRGFMPIAETLSDQEFPTLWDVLFARHPDGQYFRGQFDSSGTSVPVEALVLDMLARKPTALILDEFQTWYGGTHDDPGAGTPKKSCPRSPSSALTCRC